MVWSQIQLPVLIQHEMFGYKITYEQTCSKYIGQHLVNSYMNDLGNQKGLSNAFLVSVSLRKLFYWEVSNKMQSRVVIICTPKNRKYNNLVVLLYILYFLSVTLCVVPECLASLKHLEVIEQVMEQRVGWLLLLHVLMEGLRRRQK